MEDVEKEAAGAATTSDKEVEIIPHRPQDQSSETSYIDKASIEKVYKCVLLKPFQHLLTLSPEN